MTDADSLQAIRNREIYKLWTDIQDVIGNASKWPKGIRTLFWTRNETFSEVFSSSFLYVNGLNPIILLE